MKRKMPVIKRYLRLIPDMLKRRKREREEKRRRMQRFVNSQGGKGKRKPALKGAKP